MTRSCARPVSTVLLLVALAVIPSTPRSARAAEAREAPEVGETGERESPAQFLPPEEQLERIRGLVDRVPVGARFGVRPAAAERVETTPSWVALGPAPVGAEYWSGNAPAAGRVNSVVVDPRSSNVAYAAAAYGGVWKTIDGGTTWTPLTETLSSLSSGALALDPIDPDIVWYGTGEQNNAIDSYYGDGLFRSPDGGATWTKVATAGVSGSYISRVLVHRTTPTTLFVASERGVVRSLDGGTSWSVVLSTGTYCNDLVQNPATPATLYASFQTRGVYRSIDGGTTWSQLTSGLPASGFFRVNLAISPSNPQVLLAGFDSSANYHLLGLYRSSNGGDAWTQLTATPDYLGGQGFYDHVLAFDPADSSVAFAAGVFPYNGSTYGIIRTTNAGASWTDVTKGVNTWVHPDFHAIAFGPDGRLWVGTDGGVWNTTDRGLHWTNLNATLSITQFYTLAVQPGGGGAIVGGTQDNGTLMYSGSPTWTEKLTGDGGPVAFNRTTPTTFYATYVFMNPLYRASTVSGTATNITGPWSSDRASWANGGLTLDPNASTTLLAGTYRVWRTTNDGGAWTAISGDLTGAGNSRAVVTGIAVPVGDPNTVVATTYDGRVQVTNNLSTWNRRDTGLPAGIAITAVAVDPADEVDLVVCSAGKTGGRLFASGDAGVTWADVTGDLPAPLQVNTVAVDFRVAPHVLYAGTLAGVYASADGGLHWTLTGAGLPATAVLGVVVDPASDQLVAATHGRGMWRVPLPYVPHPHVAGVSPAFLRAGDTALGLRVTGSAFRPGAAVRLDGVARPTTYVNAGRLGVTLTAGDVATPGTHVLSVQGADPYPMVSPDAPFTVLPRDSACCLFQSADVARLAGVSGSTGVVFADFDGDGVADLAFARYDAGQVVVLRGNADGSFAPDTTLTIAGPRDLAAGDLDGDGRPDLVVAQPGLNRVSVIYGAGGGAFAGLDTLSAGTAPSHVALGDLDNDGRLDILVGQYGASVVRFYNDGPGTGGAVRAYRRVDLARGSLTSPVGLALADVDRDGFLDVLAGNATTTTAAVISGVASFADRAYTAGASGTAIATGFLDADSLVDFAVACAGDSVVAVFRNTGGGSFSRTLVPARRDPTALRIADVDGDGAADLVLACAGSATLSVLFGHDDGTFSAPLDFDAGRRPVALAVRDDGRLIAVADSLGDATLLRLDTRLKPMAFATGDAPRDLAVGDLDGDLAPDVVTANGDGTLSVLFGRGDGTLARRVDLAAPAPVQAVAIADLDGDGHPDLIAALRDGTLMPWRNAGGRTFTAQPGIAADSAARDLQVADADGVGDALDLVLTTPTTARALVHGAAFAFTPAPAVIAPAGETFHAARLRDVDGDGRPDLFVAADSSVFEYRGTGGGTFGPPTALAGGPASRALAIGDVDGDGIPDLLDVSPTAGALRVWLGVGDGTFRAASRYPTGGGASHLVLADVTGDGHLDAVMADSSSGRLMVLAGSGTGTFAPFYAYRSTRGAAAVALGDLDRDGHLDAVVAGGGDAWAVVHLKLGPSGPLAVDAEARAPALALTDIHPNPATGAQVVRFTLPRRGEADLRVFDVGGRAVATLARGVFAPGEHTASWDGRSSAGSAVAPGVYFVRLHAGGDQVTRRVARVR